jgi:hypothetical protein
MIEFNHWVKHNAATTTPPMQLLDTTHATPEDTADKVAAWVRNRL